MSMTATAANSRDWSPRVRFLIFGAMFAFLMCATPIFLYRQLGPVAVWFRPWEGESEILDLQQPTQFSLRPLNGPPNFVVLRVTGQITGSAQFRLKSLNGETIALPEELGSLQSYEWYSDGDFAVEYVPGASPSGNLKLRWIFGSAS